MGKYRHQSQLPHVYIYHVVSNVEIKMHVGEDTRFSVKSFLDLVIPRGTPLVSPKAFLDQKPRESRGFHERQLTSEQNFRLER